MILVFFIITSNSFYRRYKKSNIRYLLKYKQLHCKFGIFFFFRIWREKKVHRKQINQSTFNLTTLLHMTTIKQFLT